MRNHILSSVIFQDIVSTNEMRNVFSEEAMVQKWIDVEVALALTQAELGIIPRNAAIEIKDKGNVKYFNLENIKKGVDTTWHPLLPFIREYKALCQGDSGEYIHWGATTQDIIDTGLILQIKEAMNIIEKELKSIETILCDLAEKYKNTIMPGRTHGQHALPITFGYKVAVWADEINRHLERITQMKSRIFAGNLTGAVGTLASMGNQGQEVLDGVMKKLDLLTPTISWHVARDRIADITVILGMVGATIGKIAKEIINLQKTEINELEEPFEFGKVGSSTMPQKRNPMASEFVLGNSLLLRQRAAFGIEYMVQEHERDMGPWTAEWETISEMFQLSSGLLHHIKGILLGLKVNEDVMAENLNKSNQLIMAEAVMMKLAEKVGRQEAHDIVYRISMKTFEEGKLFSNALKDDEVIKSVFTIDDIDKILNPINYVGLSQKFVEDVIYKIRGSMEKIL